MRVGCSLQSLVSAASCGNVKRKSIPGFVDQIITALQTVTRSYFILWGLICRCWLRIVFGISQTLKNSLSSLNLGGAKGGSDFNPKGKSENEVGFDNLLTWTCLKLCLIMLKQIILGDIYSVLSKIVCYQMTACSLLTWKAVAVNLHC